MALQDIRRIQFSVGSAGASPYRRNSKPGTRRGSRRLLSVIPEPACLMKTNRRDFLKSASTATLGALAAGAPRALFAADAPEKIAPRADTIIVLWMGGGMAHTETFDPKRY